MAHQHKIGHSC